MLWGGHDHVSWEYKINKLCIMKYKRDIWRLKYSKLLPDVDKMLA